MLECKTVWILCWRHNDDLKPPTGTCLNYMNVISNVFELETPNRPGFSLKYNSDLD